MRTVKADMIKTVCAVWVNCEPSWAAQSISPTDTSGSRGRQDSGVDIETGRNDTGIVS